MTYSAFQIGIYSVVFLLQLIHKCLTMELEYLKTVKQTFGVPGSPGNHYLVVKNPSLVPEEEQHNSSVAELEQTVTVFSLTILVVFIIGVVLCLVISYFCYSFTSSFLCYMVRKREKNHKVKYLEALDTETSSLDSVETA